MGRKIRVKQGNMSIDVDSTAKDIFLDILDALPGDTIKILEDTTDEIYKDAYAVWPVQKPVETGELTEDILQDTPDTLVEHIKSKRWTDVRDWVFDHAYLHPKHLESSIYKALQDKLEDNSKPIAVLLFGQYSHKITSGADPSITLLALCTEVMGECKFK